jgi:hypothetical protein
MRITSWLRLVVVGSIALAGPGCGAPPVEDQQGADQTSKSDSTGTLEIGDTVTIGETTSVTLLNDQSGYSCDILAGDQVYVLGLSNQSALLKYLDRYPPASICSYGATFRLPKSLVAFWSTE